MSEKVGKGWSAVFSSKSMRVLSTPLIDFFRERLIEEIGEEDANKVILQDYNVMNRLDEGTPQTDFEHDLQDYFYPVYGLFEGLVGLGYDPVYAKDLVIRIWSEVPSSLKTRRG